MLFEERTDAAVEQLVLRHAAASSGGRRKLGCNVHAQGLRRSRRTGRGFAEARHKLHAGDLLRDALLFQLKVLPSETGYGLPIAPFHAHLH